MADEANESKLVKWGKAIPRGIQNAIIPASQSGLPDQVRAAPAAGDRPAKKQITMAAMIYTIGAGVLFMMAIVNLIHGSIFNGIVIFIPAGSLLVLAYKYLQ